MGVYTLLIFIGGQINEYTGDQSSKKKNGFLGRNDYG